MDIADTLIAKSDQLNACDLVGGPRTVTIAGVKVVGGEQPVSIFTEEFGNGRPFKPCLTVRRLIVAAWGADTSTYTGRKMTLYRDGSVKWAGEAIGGIRVSHLSHIDKPVSIALTETKGKSRRHHVDPLPDTPTLPALTDDDALDFERAIAEATTLDALNTIAADLKSWNLGTHRKHLQNAWSERKTVIESEQQTAAGER